MAWRKAAETFQNVTIHGLVMRIYLIIQSNIANWYKLGYKPPEMENDIFTLVTYRLFYFVTVVSTKFIFPSPLNKHFISWANTRLSQFCACCPFVMIISSCREYAPTDTKRCLPAFRSYEGKKVNKLISLQCSMTCLIIQFPWLAARIQK